jgi:hypothetical protein
VENCRNCSAFRICDTVLPFCRVARAATVRLPSFRVGSALARSSAWRMRLRAAVTLELFLTRTRTDRYSAYVNEKYV